MFSQECAEFRTIVIKGCHSNGHDWLHCRSCRTWMTKRAKQRKYLRHPQIEFSDLQFFSLCAHAVVPLATRTFSVFSQFTKSRQWAIKASNDYCEKFDEELFNHLYYCISCLKWAIANHQPILHDQAIKTSKIGWL